MTRVDGSRVGIVGGSIAGCGAAIALGRLGCDVTVFERSSGVLRDRGSGIAIPIRLHDAATLSRPHTGNGATKALQDARRIETLGAEHGEWESLLAAYDGDRTPAGQTLVALGRRIGRDQVEATPPWLDMTPDDFESWTKGTLSGDQLYSWGDQAE